MRVDPTKINFYSQDWKTFKLWLLEQKESNTGLLIAADTQDKSNRIRGSLQFINTILALETAAYNAARAGVSLESGNDR